MKKFFKWLAIILAGLVALLVALAILGATVGDEDIGNSSDISGGSSDISGGSSDISGRSNDRSRNTRVASDQSVDQEPAPTAPPPVRRRPRTQDQFISAVAESQQGSRAAANDMARGGILSQRNRRICQIIGSSAVRNWTGTVVDVSSNSEGWGVFAVEIAEDIALKTWNNALSDIGDDTLIQPGTAVFQSAATMSRGDEVVFSGTFIRDNSTCINEQSMTMSGNLRAPEFTFRFTAVRSID